MIPLIAIDIGGTKLAVALADAESFSALGQILVVKKEPITSPGRPDDVISRAVAIATEILEESGVALPTRRPAGIGISIGGPLDHVLGTVVNFPHLPDWLDVPLCRIVSERLGAPCRLDNDANLGALAEHRFGSGRGAKSMVYTTISTGIGAGIILDGKLVHGVGSAAGEVGHITVAPNGPYCPCGNRGCMEIMASGTAIARRARQAVEASSSYGDRMLELAGGNTNAITAAIVHTAMRDGDALAVRVWEDTAEFLAIGLASVIHVLAPEIVVLGGGVAQAGDDLLEPLRRHIREHVFYVPMDCIRIEAAQLGHDSALVGAMVLAVEAAGE